jgi:hypothetical protein
MEHRDPDYIAARNALIPSAELKANRIAGWTAPKGEEARHSYCAKWNYLLRRDGPPLVRAQRLRRADREGSVTPAEFAGAIFTLVVIAIAIPYALSRTRRPNESPNDACARYIAEMRTHSAAARGSEGGDAVASDSVDSAVFIWQRGHCGATEVLRHLSWRGGRG